MESGAINLNAQAHIAAAAVLAGWFRLDYARWLVGRFGFRVEIGLSASRVVSSCISGTGALDRLYSGPRAMVVVGHLERAAVLGSRAQEIGDWDRVSETADLIEQEYVGAVSRRFWGSSVDAVCARCELRVSCGVVSGKLEREVLVPSQRFAIAS